MCQNIHGVQRRATAGSSDGGRIFPFDTEASGSAACCVENELTRGSEMEGLEVTVMIGMAILVGTIVAPRIRVALPLVLVALGLALGFIPALREIQLPPETVLLLFLPVMLFWEALTTSLRSVRRDFRYILPMSTVLVAASAFAVAGVAMLFGLPWPAAFILGAAVAPPDATAVAALGRMLPSHMFMKLKAESLTNDGTALVLYAIAVTIAMGGHITPLSVTWSLAVSYVGGLLVGIAVAFLMHTLLRTLTGTIEINLTLFITPFVAFLLAELIEASGVLAVVVAGLIAAWVSPRVTTPASRQQAQSVYPVLTFILNGALFVLIGLEVMYVVFNTAPRAIGGLVLATFAVWVTLTLVRYLFQTLSTFSRAARVARTNGVSPHRVWVVSTFAGFRGAVSLAIALSIPLTTDAGEPLDGRSQVIFITAGVILLSLLVQGPMLPAVVRWAKLPSDDAADQERELAYRTITGAALAAIDDLAEEHGISDQVRDAVRVQSYTKLEYQNAKIVARQKSLAIDEPDGVTELSSMTQPIATNEDGTLRLIASSTDVDLMQLSPLVMHEQHVKLHLALLDRQKEVLLRLQREGAVDNLVALQIRSRMDGLEVKLRGVEDEEL